MNDREKAALTLFINRSDSRCGACNGGADPYQKTHQREPHWNPGKLDWDGCGVEWKFVSSDYSDHSGLYRRIQEMRPDLTPWFWEDDPVRHDEMDAPI